MRKYRIVGRYFSEHDCLRFVAQKRRFLLWWDMSNYWFNDIDNARDFIKGEDRKRSRKNEKCVVIEEIEFY